MVGGDAGAEGGLILGDLLLEVDGRVPVEVGGGVPLVGLGLLVQLAQRRPGEGVVPREDGVGVVGDDVGDLVDVGVGDGEDGLDVVDIGAADEVLGGGHGTTSLWG